MLKTVQKRLLTLVQNQIRELECPACKTRFKPFADRQLASFAELVAPCACPKCGRQFAFTQAVETAARQKRVADEPQQKPEVSKIERQPVSETELLFYIPATGRAGGLMFMAVVWNIISLTAGGAVLHAAIARGDFSPALLIIVLFLAIGAGLAYAAARARYASHLLYLSSEIVRLQRKLFRKRNYELRTADLSEVKHAVFYTQNYQPVHGIEISAATGKSIRFGSALTEPEKNWLCWEIRTFLRSVGAAV